MAINGWQSIMAQIVSVLQGLSDIGEVDNWEKSSFRNFPAITVTPADNQSNFEATDQRIRIYSFNIRVYLEMLSNQQGGSGDGLKETDRIMRDVIDMVTNTFDKPANARLGGTVLLVEPMPSIWAYDTVRNMRVATVTLRCQVYVDTNAIT